MMIGIVAWPLKSKRPCIRVFTRIQGRDWVPFPFGRSACLPNNAFDQFHNWRPVFATWNTSITGRISNQLLDWFGWWNLSIDHCSECALFIDREIPFGVRDQKRVVHHFKTDWCATSKRQQQLLYLLWSLRRSPAETWHENIRTAPFTALLRETRRCRWAGGKATIRYLIRKICDASLTGCT